MESDPGRGARIRIFVPAVVEKTQVGKASLSPVTDECQAMRIVVVEDQLLVRQLVEAMLKKAGHEVVSFTGMAELTAALEDEAVVVPDVALVDLTLNDGDGVQALGALRNYFGSLGVVLMSGYDSTDALTRISDHRHLTFLEVHNPVTEVTGLCSELRVS